MIRTGYVSNSSSSSFCIYGIYGDRDEILRQFFPNYDAESEQDDGDDLDWEERLENLLRDDKTHQLHMEALDGDNIGVGRSWRDIGDEETGADFKASVRRDLDRLRRGVDLEDPDTHEEAWYC